MEQLVMPNHIDYLVEFDNLLVTYMLDNAIKLALFISNNRGYGSEILNYFIPECRASGKNKMFLWTDSTCNHGYYPSKGFEKILSVNNANANIGDDQYRTLFYSMTI